MFRRGKDQVSEIASDEYPFLDPASGNSNSASDARYYIEKNPRHGVKTKLPVVGEG